MLKRFKKILYPFEELLFFAMYVFVTFALCLDVFVAGTVLAFCFTLRLCRAVMCISEHISDSLESLNEFTSDLGEYANDILSKKQNKEKSNS
jgi:hypothetical protein